MSYYDLGDDMIYLKKKKTPTSPSIVGTYGGLAQPAEAIDLKSIQCGFESHGPYHIFFLTSTEKSLS